MKFKLFVYTITLSSVMMVSCSSSSETTTQSDEITDSSSTVTANDTAKYVEEEDVFYNLRSALQIAYVFKKSNATFNSKFINSANNTAKYNISNYKRAVNFGVYSSDLAYIIFNKKYQESKNYLKACKDVGGYLGINQAFESDNIAQRFDSNISNEDSLVKIVSDVQLKTDALFEQNKQKHITVLAFAGAWAESIYIANESYQLQKSNKILACLVEQILLSETIIKALKHCEGKEPEIKNLKTEIETIYNIFSAIPTVKAMLESDNDVDFSTLKITDEELKATTALVTTLRNRMVQ